MSRLKIKINRYNEGGFPQFLPKAEDGMDLSIWDERPTPYDNSASLRGLNTRRRFGQGFDKFGSNYGGAVAGAATAWSNSIETPMDKNYLQNSDYFRQSMKAQKDREKAVDVTSSAVAAIPVAGWAVAAGLQVGKGVGKFTKDKYGIYKSKAAEELDNAVNPVKGISNIGSIFEHPSVANNMNVFTGGIFGKSYADEEAKRQKRKYENMGISSASVSGNRSGSLTRAAMGGYRATPYGKKGMKFRTKYSHPWPQKQNAKP